ncbi:2OG-Fe dioxygenase family protein [Streptomyces sp. NPDC047821]|uniref:2OG-Fe dioxygenase family protein n=1 Tax=Streptomyces sp. NPDC047821 TaxID=3365488 RepID=UPI00371A7E14
MDDVVNDRTVAHTAPVADAREALLSTGAYVMPPAAVSECLGTDAHGWACFAAHWEDLAPDTYAAERGTRRLRRYGHFLLSRTGDLALQPHIAFVQPEDTNPLYVDVDRHFEPLTDAFLSDPLLTPLLRMLGDVASCLDDAAEWSVKVHPFRVVASADSQGAPTPEGRHRDGVTLVTSLLVGRDNVTGGESTVYDPGGGEVLTTTLTEPGTLLLGDDRATLHGVSPVRPLDTARPAHRDVLVTTLTAR